MTTAMRDEKNFIFNPNDLAIEVSSSFSTGLTPDLQRF
jgi:hypothetical protein